jgi:hypothetical protein
VIPLLEEPCAPYWRIVLAPATDLRIACLNQALLLGMCVASKRLPEGVHMPLDGGGARGERGLETVQTTATLLAGRGFSRRVLLEVEAKEIKPWLLWSHVQGMGDTRLARLQG